MRVPKIAFVCGVAALLALATATPAQAGGWAVTYLDPLPDRFEAGRAYTVGFWVLQHGSHPYEGDLGRVAITLVDAKKVATPFAAVRLREPAHYAAAIAVDRPGTFQVIAVQGVFGEYEIGTLTVPGGLTVAATPTPMDLRDGHKHEWGAIRPPITHADDGHPATQAASNVPAVAAESTRGTPIGTLAGVAGVTIAAAIVLVARRPLAHRARDAWRRVRR